MRFSARGAASVFALWSGLVAVVLVDFAKRWHL